MHRASTFISARCIEIMIEKCTNRPHFLNIREAVPFFSRANLQKYTSKVISPNSETYGTWYARVHQGISLFPGIVYKQKILA